LSKIRLEFVQAFQARGKPFHYFRRGGQRVRLPGLPGSAEYMTAYAAALAGSGPVVGASRSLPGSIAAWVAGFLGSDEFKAKPYNTRRTLKAPLERLREQHGEKRGAHVNAEVVRAILAKLVKPHARRNWLKAIRALMVFAVAQGWRKDDPTLGIKKQKAPKTGGFKTWEEDDIALYRAKHPLGTLARLALELLLNVGQRRGDTVRMGRQHIRLADVELRGGRRRLPVIVVQQNKGGLARNALKIPILPELQAALDATPLGNLTFLTSPRGKPFSADRFGQWFRGTCDEAGCFGLAAHGLRKAMCVRLAHADCTAPQIAAISGHKSLQEVQRYIDAVQQERLGAVAMDKLENETALALSNLPSPLCQTGA
jgi:integrase